MRVRMLRMTVVTGVVLAAGLACGAGDPCKSLSCDSCAKPGQKMACEAIVKSDNQKACEIALGKPDFATCQ